ncbi:MAG: ATP-binding cassette domain-containing protein [Geodermatophilaceae bacterium]|nr:ATP-binding cassette domain-containing protein [Geodermatophilaceae bacterium]
MEPTIFAQGLRKYYGDVPALDGFDLTVPAGTVCALLGPNGAGKTTAVRIFSTLLRPDAGRAEVAGCDVTARAAEVRRRIGLVGQHAAIDEILSGRQNLELFGRLYHLGRRGARNRADELLERFGLADSGGNAVSTYSGGMRRRLDVASSLILAPSVLFLDEPTTGLDPRGRAEVWDMVRQLVNTGTTVLLTTQYLDEADQLAGQIAVLNSGRVIAEGTPDKLKARIGGDRIEIVVDEGQDLAVAGAALAAVAGGRLEIDTRCRRLSAPVADRRRALYDAVRALDVAGVRTEDVAIRRPTLDDVFLHLTGQSREESLA